MAEIGPFAEELFFLIVKEQKGYWSQTVKEILSLNKKYPKEVVDKASQRALAYGAFQYQIVKRICEKGTYVLPLELTE